MKFRRNVFLMLATFILAITTYATSNDVHASTSVRGSLAQDMQEMIDRGILSGYEDGTYRPGEMVTRGQFAAFIARAIELPNGTGGFTDVPSSMKLATEINKVKQAGLMSGYDDNSFKPYENITREQVAMTIENVLRYSRMDLIEKRIDFTDANEFTSSGSLRTVFHATHYGIISGYPNTDGTLRFEPKSPATREHAAAFISRFLKAKEGAPDQPEQPVEPETPTPPTNSEDYQLAKIQNGKLVKDSKTYPKYLDAANLFNNDGNGFSAMYRGDELIRIKSGIAYSNNFVTNTAGRKVAAVTTIYESYSGTTFSKQISYIEHGREMRYIDANADAVKVQVGSTIGWAKHSEVDFIPLELISNREHYTKNQYGTLEHYVYNHMSKRGASYTIGQASPELVVGERYYSYDGVHFNNNRGSLVATDYSYFQFLSARAKTSYTAEELDQHIKARLVAIESTGAAKYKDASKKSKLIGTGKYMIEMQNKHNVNALFILAAAIHESDYGTSANAYGKNNLFGIRVYDSAPEAGEVFPKPEDSIQSFVLDYMNKNYIPPTALHANGAAPGNKTSGFNVKYASDPNWGSKIAGHMYRIDIDLGKKDIHKEKLIMTSYPGSINVRSEPSTSSKIIFKYPARILGYANDMGNPLVVIEEKKGADGYLWYKVLSDHPSYEDGWIREDLVSVISNN